MTDWKAILGSAVFLTALVGVAFANTGAGGGCHADFYFNVDGAGQITTNTMYCKDIDCPEAANDAACPANSGPGTGGYTTCFCPSMTGTCNFGFKETTAGLLVKCVWGCPGSEACYGPTPASGGYYPGGTIGGVVYAHKMTCWCE